MSDTESQCGIAPADGRAHARWSRWRVALAYLVLLGVALGAIWLMDGHMMSATAK